nr:transaminase [Motilibacter rhizosphaerae]
MIDVPVIDRSRLAALLAEERDAYVRTHPGSAAVHARAEHLLGRVPMTWMGMWTGGFPLAFREAKGARVVDVDGTEYVDFALGDTGAMAGHSPSATVAAVRRRIDDLGGITTMMPTEDAEVVAAELTRRFGLARWSFTLSATDANRWALRLARLVTGRPKVLVFSYSYHGTVDESFVVVGPDGQPRSRPGNVGPAVDPTTTTRVVEWNDLAALERELAAGDVAAVLTEPALTNIGIVLPEPGFLEGVRELTRAAGTLLIIDETHTLSAGPGGMTARDGLQPDLLTIGKSIGGGVPAGAYGVSAEVADRLSRAVDETGADLVDVGGVGGTLAGNALSLAAVRATLEDVLTEDAFERMVALGTAYAEQVRSIIETRGLPWSVVQLGARAEYRFTAPAPRNGGESAAAADEELDAYLHLHLANRGVLLTPFHNMALMCPETTIQDVARHTALFGGAVDALLG